MGVALAPCSLPQTRRSNFELGEGEMEVGLGIHLEPGVGREALKPADAVTDALVDRIYAEMKPKRGYRVAVLVNSLGATPLMELYTMMPRVKARLDDVGASIDKGARRPLLHLARDGGASVTMMRLDDEVARFIDHPADCAMFQFGLKA